jgi:hypothetical protein
MTITTLFIFLICAGIFSKSRAERCYHTWELKRTETIRRGLGQRPITSYHYKCFKCGATKTEIR